MASIGLWVAFFMSLRFMTPGHTQMDTPPLPSNDVQKVEAPSSGDLPPEFSQDDQGGTLPNEAKIPPPPSQPPMPPQRPEEPVSPSQSSGISPDSPAVVTTPPPTMEANNPAAAMQTEGTAPVIPQFASDDQYTYDPTGHRDPFKPYKSYRPAPTSNNSSPVKVIDPMDPLQRWDVDRFSVVAILWEVRLPKAMVKDPDGKMYMISKSTKIGRNSGQVVAIREGEVVVVEAIENEGVQTKEVKILELKK
jgi:type IV pilus assembly protein PilP